MMLQASWGLVRGCTFDISRELLLGGYPPVLLHRLMRTTLCLNDAGRSRRHHVQTLTVLDCTVTEC